MSYFCLWFSSARGLALERTSLQSPLLGEINTVRGKTGGAFVQCNSFQWTPAVKALSLLILHSVSNQFQNQDQFVMRGGRGSAASSLDYAISKRNAWVMDMFGVDSRGNCLAQKYIRRSNSHRKHGEAVSISFNSQAMGLKEIRIFLNDERVSDGAALQGMIVELETAWVLAAAAPGQNGEKPTKVNSRLNREALRKTPAPVKGSARWSWLRELIHLEVESVVSAALPFVNSASMVAETVPAKVAGTARRALG